MPTPLCVGFGAAARLAQAGMSVEAERLLGLRRRFLAGITARLPQVRLNGDAERRLPGNLNLSFDPNTLKQNNSTFGMTQNTQGHRIVELAVKFFF